MKWDEATQRRFDHLRERHLVGELSVAEQHELDTLLTLLDAEEASYLAPAIARMDQERHQAETQLTALQNPQRGTGSPRPPARAAAE
jgi:hypothetical protein